MENKIDLSRFIQAHKTSFQSALNEIKNARKETHWMWYIFPQIHGLGMSETSQYYAITGIEEAKAFLNDSYLGGNLQEICLALLSLESSNAAVIFGYPDDIKLKSSMTLFAAVSGEGSVFHQVLDKFFGGNQDQRTLAIIKSEN